MAALHSAAISPSSTMQYELPALAGAIGSPRA
jgi:hypothetical protein